MPPSVFLDRDATPRERQLGEVLGRASAAWTRLRADLAKEFAPLEEHWSYSGKAYGWSLQLKQKKRAIVYLVPGEGGFVASFALGEKACAAARAAGVSARVLEAIERAPKYAEGRGVRLEVRKLGDLADIRTLAAIKMAN